MKRIILIGSTGSVGLQTLDIIRSHPDDYSIVALSCHNRADRLREQAAEFSPRAVAFSDTALKFPIDLASQTHSGTEGVCRMIRETEAEIVVNAAAGAAGLLPSFAALESGKNLALANKETMVMAGTLAREAAAKHGRAIIPVDSEHSAVFNLTRRLPSGTLDEVILTASGGPFRDRPLETLNDVTVAETLRHPTWNMGKKITVDSATMANKALEVIEARRFFDVAPEKIKVVIHPQSLVHSLIRTRDGSLYAQISRPDMRLPILNALAFPACPNADFASLDISRCVMEFLPVDENRYPLLVLGYRALQQDGAWPTVFNAANEVAVAAFLEGRLSFTGIAPVVEQTLEAGWPNLNRSLDDVILHDTTARAKASAFVNQAR
jgi:1-deoxy-D-xylulose-5-phosphate reductoisomerase